MGLDCTKLRGWLLSNQVVADVEILPFHKLLERVRALDENGYIFYSSSYDAAYRKYIADTVRYISCVRPDIRFLPSYDSLLAHENKGYQELLKLRWGMTDLWGQYFGDISDFDPKICREFPYVIKLLEGSVSSNVFLVRDYGELCDEIRRRKKEGLKLRLKRRFKNYVMRTRYGVTRDNVLAKNFDEFFSTRLPFVAQRYVPNLTHDYKVLIFGDKYYALKRYVRKGDFRASGSGLFEYEAPSDAVLNFSKQIFDRAGEPFISLDIVECENRCHLIEFQGIGFGPLTLENSTGYYCYRGGYDERRSERWVFVEESPDLERTYAEAIGWYLAKRVDVS